MRNLEIVFVNHAKLGSKLRHLKGDLRESREELRHRLDGLHRSLSDSLRQWQHQRGTGAMVFELNHKGYHPHLLVTDLTR
ncbi:MAG: hypothetical protein GC192_22915 [Bacteroidetes bacterium]|nr:hypothetical protein [Bacteroidota bacterium]